MNKITKIVLAGAADELKQNVISSVEKHYSDNGYSIFCHDYDCDASVDSNIEAEDSFVSEHSDADSKTILLFNGCAVDKYKKYSNPEIVRIWSRYDAVIYVDSPQSANIDDYVGHPHLRYVPSACSLDDKFSRVVGEINCILSSTETEKKFLIEYPDMAELKKYKPFMCEIEQVYLKSDIGSHRIRKRGSNGVYVYFETLKIRINDFSCNEFESVISEERYNELLADADTDKHPIKKKRYCFLYEGKYFELDIFPFWNDKAFVELEIKHISEQFVLPPEIKVIKDVSEDKHYKNNYLAGIDL